MTSCSVAQLREIYSCSDAVIGLESREVSDLNVCPTSTTVAIRVLRQCYLQLESVDQLDVKHCNCTMRR
jgi:hypothetical protein